MAKTTREALSEANIPANVIERVVGSCMPDTEVREAARFPTNLRKLKDSKFERIYRHGWRVADCNLRAHRPDLFAHVPKDRQP